MTNSGSRDERLASARVLVAEDEFLLLLELEAVLRDAGAKVIHLCRSVEDALACIDAHSLTVAILDIRLGRDAVTPVARRLAKNNIPFLFHTGEAQANPIVAEWSHCRVVAKPARPRAIVDAVLELVDG